MYILDIYSVRMNDEISVPRSQRSYGQTDMAGSTRLVILIKNIYTLWSRKRLLLPVTYFLTNLV